MAAPQGRAAVVVERSPDDLMQSFSLSVVVPVLNEAANLNAFLQNLLERLPDDAEVIVADGGSSDSSLEIAEQHPVRVVRADKGRARQMNSGAKLARGRYLMFLHADTTLPENFADEFEGWLQSQPVWGFFPLRLTGDQFWCRIIERAINLRTSVTAGASGDQAQIVDALYFRSLGGFPDIELMEDIALSYRLRKSWPVRRFRTAVTTSSRRWQQRGVVRTVVLMWFLRSAYRLGVAPSGLAKWYGR